MYDGVTTQTRSRYNRIAPLHDLMEAFVKRRAFQKWRQRVWSTVEGKRVLEVGVGTGKNMPYYPQGSHVTAVDLSERMLARAKRRADELGIEVDLRLMDAQRLDFPERTFDAVVATFVFCSVPDPVQGLQELGRVLKRGGHVVLLEHVLVDRPLVGKLMQLLDPLVVRLVGAHIKRRTVENVKKAGLHIDLVEELVPSGLVKLIIARADSGRKG